MHAEHISGDKYHTYGGTERTSVRERISGTMYRTSGAKERTSVTKGHYAFNLECKTTINHRNSTI